MTDRFNFLPLLVAHWKVLSKDNPDGSTSPDWLARMGLLVPSIVVFAVMWTFDGRLASTGVLLSAVSLLASGLLAVFAQLANFRMKMTEWYERGSTHADSDKDAMDESVTHVLFAVLLSFFNATVIVVGLTMGPEDASSLRGLASWIVAGGLTYTALLAVILVPRLLYAYTRVNKVRRELSGYYKSV